MQDIYVSDELRRVERLHAQLFDGRHFDLTIRELLGRMAENHAGAHRHGNEDAAVEIKNWHPELAGASPERIMSAQFVMTDALAVIAREHGYDDWEQVRAEGKQRLDPDFEEMVNLVNGGDMDSLDELLQEMPEIAVARSRFMHAPRCCTT